MDKKEALEVFKNLWRNQAWHDGLSKEEEEVIREAYNTLYKVVCDDEFHYFKLNDQLSDSINNGDLLLFSQIYEQNGYEIKLYVDKIKDKE